MLLNNQNIPEYIKFLREDTSRLSGRECLQIIEAFEHIEISVEQWHEVMAILQRRGRG